MRVNATGAAHGASEVPGEGAHDAAAVDHAHANAPVRGTGSAVPADVSKAVTSFDTKHHANRNSPDRSYGPAILGGTKNKDGSWSVQVGSMPTTIMGPRPGQKPFDVVTYTFKDGKVSVAGAAPKPAGHAPTEAAVQKAYDDGAFSAGVDRKDLPKAAQKQLDADVKQGKDDGYDTSATKGMIGGQPFFAVGKDDSDTGDYHVNIFDAAGTLVASGGGTEHDGEYWNKL